MVDWNLNSSDIGRKWGNFLTGTDPDRALEFEVDAMARPVRPVDPRLDAVTPQYYAAATYGALQIGLQRWLVDVPTTSELNRILNGGDGDTHSTPIFKVLEPDSQRMGIAIGAFFHRRERRTLKGYCEGCSGDEWKRFWSDVLRAWNANGSEYKDAVNKVVSRAEDEYSPR